MSLWLRLKLYQKLITPANQDARFDTSIFFGIFTHFTDIFPRISRLISNTRDQTRLLFNFSVAITTIHWSQNNLFALTTQCTMHKS